MEHRLIFHLMDLMKKARKLNNETISASEGLKEYELNVQGAELMRLSFTNNQLEKSSNVWLPLILADSLIIEGRGNIFPLFLYIPLS